MTARGGAPMHRQPHRNRTNHLVREDLTVYASRASGDDAVARFGLPESALFWGYALLYRSPTGVSAGDFETVPVPIPAADDRTRVATLLTTTRQTR